MHDFFPPGQFAIADLGHVPEAEILARALLAPIRVLGLALLESEIARAVVAFVLLALLGLGPRAVARVVSRLAAVEMAGDIHSLVVDECRRSGGVPEPDVMVDLERTGWGWAIEVVLEGDLGWLACNQLAAEIWRLVEGSFRVASVRVTGGVPRAPGTSRLTDGRGSRPGSNSSKEREV